MTVEHHKLKIGSELIQSQIFMVIQLILNGLKVHWLSDHVVVVWGIVFVHGTNERPGISMPFDVFDYFVHPNLNIFFSSRETVKQNEF